MLWSSSGLRVRDRVSQAVRVRLCCFACADEQYSHTDLRKKDRANIEARELAAFRELADIVLGYSESEIAKRVADGALLEILPQEQ